MFIYFRGINMKMLWSTWFLFYLFSFGVEIMQEPEPIDWEYYRKGIGSKLVDMYKEAYDSKFLLSTWLIVILIPI